MPIYKPGFDAQRFKIFFVIKVLLSFIRKTLTIVDIKYGFSVAISSNFL